MSACKPAVAPPADAAVTQVADAVADTADVDVKTAVDVASDATASAVDAGTDTSPTLYEKLGKHAGLKIYASTLFEEMSWTKVLNFYLPPKGSPQMAAFQAKFVDYLAMIWGCTGCPYAGDTDMHKAHAALMIAPAEWAAFTGLMYEVMNEELLIPNDTIIAALQVVEQSKAAIVDTTSLYARFGGRQKVRKVVGQLLTVHLANDPVLGPRFANSDQDVLATKITDYIAAEMLGQKLVKYQGKPLAAAHAGMKISASEVDTFVQLLGKAMADYNVAAAEKAELLALVAAAAKSLVGL